MSRVEKYFPTFVRIARAIVKPRVKIEQLSVGRFRDTAMAGSQLVDPYPLVSYDPRPKRGDQDLRVNQEHIRFSALCYREMAKTGKQYIESVAGQLRPEAKRVMERQIAEAERNAAYLELLASGGGIDSYQDAAKIQRAMRWQVGADIVTGPNEGK